MRDTIKKPDFEEFTKANPDLCSNTLKRIEQANYWEAGQYDAKLIFSTKRPNKDHVFEFNFSITQEDHDIISRSAIKTIWNACGINVIFNQISKNIEDFKKE